MRERYARLCNRTTPHSGGVAQPNSNNQENVSLKKDEEGADQDPGSDDDMEDEDIMEDEDVENEEEEGDESSEYQPTVVPTDLDDAEVSEDDDLMEQEDTSEHCGQGQFAFLELPREIRDKIYGLVVKLDNSMSDRVIRFKCPSKSCRGLTEADQSAWELQLPEVRELFRTCRQIHNEAKKIFYEVNSWSLSRAKLGVNPKDPAAILHDTNIMFHRLRHIGGTKNFRHINMRIYLSDRALCDLGVPTTIDMDDTRAVLLYQMNQDPVHIGKHILSEGEQCELYRVALKGLADNRLRNFPNLRSLTLQVALHSKKRYSISNDPLNCCGLTFYVTVQFGYMEAPHIHREYVQQRGVPSDNYTIPPDENLSMYQPTRWLGNSGYTWGPEYPNIWDPRRRMLAPLAGLRDIRNIEVERRWSVRYNVQDINGQTVVVSQPVKMVQHFSTVLDFLDSAGQGLENLLDPGLEQLKIPVKDVVEILENKTEDGVFSMVSLD